jgi:hypothetical protein
MFLKVIFMSNSKVRLYVKSLKTVTGTTEIEREVFTRTPSDRPDRVKVEGKVAEGTFRVRLFETETEPKYDFVLPEDQQRVVEMVKQIAFKYGLEVEVVDVAKENALHRFLEKEVKKLKVFPTLIIDSAEKIEGKITEKQAESVLSHLKRTGLTF